MLRAPMHLIAFTDEEGIRFKSTFLGSRAVVRCAAGAGPEWWLGCSAMCSWSRP